MNEDNEALLRTYHPDLSQFRTVYRGKELRGTLVWVVFPEQDIDVYPIQVANREVHLGPSSRQPTMTSTFTRHVLDPILGIINPRRFLLRNDIEMLKTLYPSSTGARVYVSGFIVLLYHTQGDIEKDWSTGLGAEFGSLRVRYEIINHRPSKTALRSGFAVCDKPDYLESSAALGLKLKGPEFGTAITVPTHAFVNVASASRVRCWTTERFIEAKRYLYRLLPINRFQWEFPALGRAWGPLRNISIGQSVFLAGTNKLVGVISKTFDPPARPLVHFPIGFAHDLSLITAGIGASLPELASPDSTPLIRGWGSYKDVLDGKSIFVTGQVVSTGNKKPREGTGVSETAQRALMEGLEYLWDRGLASVDVSFLWRTRFDGDRLGGMSGAVLCSGSLTDSTCKAIVFQNFEIPVRPGSLLDDPENAVIVKGGFLLPPEIRRSEILCDMEEQSEFNGNTFPRRSQDHVDVRRYFST